MANEEAIKWLKQSIADCTTEEDEPFKSAFGISILALQENTKLKAEIEQLDAIVKTYRKLYIDTIDEREILTKRIE